MNAGVLWLAAAGFLLAVVLLEKHNWRATIVLAGGALSVFALYVVNLYANNVSILLPGW